MLQYTVSAHIALIEMRFGATGRAQPATEVRATLHITPSDFERPCFVERASVAPEASAGDAAKSGRKTKKKKKKNEKSSSSNCSIQ